MFITMVLEKLEIDGFGIYSDFSLDKLKEGVNVVLGNNEAGKTTLLKFLRYTLFGYPRLRENRMAPIRGGAHGGRIMALLSSGQPVTIERHGSNNLAVWLGNEQFSNEHDLFRLLGNATSSLYNNVYAITLDELVGLGSLSESGVEDRIFSVGMGLGNISLADIDSDIRNLIGEIYKSAGRNQQIPEILKAISERRAEISEKQTYLPKRKELTAELERIEKEGSGLREESRRVLLSKNRLENFLKCHDSVVTLVNAEAELEVIPGEPDLPENGLQDLKLLENKKEVLNERLERLNSGDGEEKGIAELDDLAASIFFNRLLLEQKVKVEFLKNNLNVYRNMLLEYSDDEAEIKRLDKQAGEILENISPGGKDRDIADFRYSGSHKAFIDSFRQQLAELNRKKIAAETYAEALKHRESSLNIPNIAFVFSGLLLIGSITAFFYSLYITGGALAAAAILLFAGRKFMVKEPPLAAVETELDEIKNSEEKVKESFSNYLADISGMSGEIPVEAAEGVLAEMDRAAELMRRRMSISEKQTRQRKPFMDKFESIAKELDSLIEDKEDTGNPEIIAGRIISEFALSMENFNRKTYLEDELRKKTREAERINRQIGETGASISALLKTAGASDTGEFAWKYRQNEKYAQLTAARDNALQTIESIAGVGRAPDIVTFFRTTGKEEVIADIADIKNISADTDEKVRESERRIGELRNEIKKIEEDADMTVAMTGLETGRHNLKKALINWLSGRLALELLAEVRAGYEREKQPAVINNASRYFSAVTGGRYSRLHVSAGDKDVKVYDGYGAYRTTGQLSRGTKEQLLVSLRLGFIEEYEKQAEPLPLVTDEVLVNFDPARARRIAELLYEFSKGRQTVIFSCHPGTADLFDGKDINLVKL
jgi:uncharacterized protein YhaN